MAKAKKKLNTNFLVTVAAVASAIVLSTGGVGYFVYKAKRPDQLKAEGRELMIAGNYEEAFKRFSRAGSRKATDLEFLTWMQETQWRLTSFNPENYKGAYGLLSAIINASPDKPAAAQRKLVADLAVIDTTGMEQISPEMGRDFESTAKLVLEADPKNPQANLVRATTRILPLFQPGAVPTSAEVQTVVEQVKEIHDLVPGEPDIIIRYALALLKHREALIREMSIPETTNSAQAVALYNELRGLSDKLVAIGDNESLPTTQRARAHMRNFDLLQIAIQTRLAPRGDIEPTLGPSMVKSIRTAAELVKPEDEIYVGTRLKYANFLTTVKNLDEAIKVLRETTEKSPKQWVPTINLANVLSDAGKPVEAVEALSVEKKPDYELTGYTGVMFVNDQDIVPLRRAFFRLQSLALLPADKRDAEIARVESDYNTATSRVGESNPYALQIKAGLQEIRQDRTGAIATLEEARSKLGEAPNARQLLIRINEQLITLNNSLGQTGRSEELAEQLVRLSPGDFTKRILLIDLKLKNGKDNEARGLLTQTSIDFPDQPALAALRIRLQPDEASKRAELDKIPSTGKTPEQTRQLVEIKMKVASEAGLESAAGEIAEAFLKDNPDDYRVTLMYVQSLLRTNQREEALRRLKALKAKDPTDTNIDKAIAFAEANTPEELQRVWEETASKSSPLNQLVIEARQALSKGDEATYIAKMREAEKLDDSGIGAVTEQIYYYYMQAGKLDEAEAELNKLSQFKRDPVEVQTNRLRIKLARAAIMQAEGKAAESAKLFDEATAEANAMASRMPQFSGGWIVKGLALNARGQLAEAFDAFKSALEAQPNNAEALRFVVELSYALGRGDDMRRFIETGKRLAPNDPYYDQSKVRYEVAFGDPKAAIEPRTKQRDAAPNDPNTWLALGETYLAASKKATDQAEVAELRKKAIQTFNEAGEKFTDSPGFGLAAATVMHEAGDTAGAQKRVDELYANPANVENAGFLAALANYYIERKQPEPALEVMKKLLESGKGNNNQLRAQMARLYAESGKTEEALAMLEGVPDSTDSRELRLNLLLSGNKIKEANDLSNAFLAKEKTVTNLLMVAHTEGLLGNVSKAIDMANQAIALEPNNPATHLYKAKMMMAEKPPRNNEILELLDTTLKIAPGNAEARLLMSDRLREAGRMDESINELERLLEADPNNRPGLLRLIQAYMNQGAGRYPRIDSIFEKLRNDGRMDAELLTVETGYQRKKGDKEAAVRSAREAAQKDPNNVGLYRQLVEVYIWAGQYRDVLADLDRIQKSNENVYWTYMLRGIVLHRQKKETEAAAQWDRALGITQSLRDDSPTGEVVERYAAEYGSEATGKWLKDKMGDDPRMRALMLNLYAGEGKFPEAVRMGESLLPVLDTLNRPTQLMVLGHLGNSYMLGSPSQPAKARDAFKKLAELDPTSDQAMNNLAYAMMLEGSDIAGAAVIAEKAYNLTMRTANPNESVVDTYGWALVRSGKVQEGIDVLRSASAIREIPDTAYHLGEAYILEGQKDAAEQSLQKALDLVQIFRKNGELVDSSLEDRIRDALARALAMPAR